MGSGQKAPPSPPPASLSRRRRPFFNTLNPEGKDHFLRSLGRIIHRDAFTEQLTEFNFSPPGARPSRQCARLSSRPRRRADESLLARLPPPAGLDRGPIATADSTKSRATRQRTWPGVGRYPSPTVHQFVDSLIWYVYCLCQFPPGDPHRPEELLSKHFPWMGWYTMRWDANHSLSSAMPPGGNPQSPLRSVPPLSTQNRCGTGH